MKIIMDATVIIMGATIVHGTCHSLVRIISSSVHNYFILLRRYCTPNHLGWFLRGYPDEGSCFRDHRTLEEKLTPAQKRQEQRDERRHKFNPHRTQEEEDAERIRKQHQGLFDDRRDPAHRQYGDHEFMWKRQQKLEDWNADYDALHPHPGSTDGKKDFDPMPDHWNHYYGTEDDHDVKDFDG